MKSTPCLRRLVCRFASSHSYSITERQPYSPIVATERSYSRLGAPRKIQIFVGVATGFQWFQAFQVRNMAINRGAL